MTPDDKKRRNSLLATLAFEGGSTTARVLRDQMDVVHGLPSTIDRVRADLSVLADLGAVRKDGDLAMLTEEGREHVQRLRELF